MYISKEMASAKEKAKRRRKNNGRKGSHKMCSSVAGFLKLSFINFVNQETLGLFRSNIIKKLGLLTYSGYGTYISPIASCSIV